MDQPTATIIAAFIILLGGLLSYSIQKRIDRVEERHRQFRSAVLDYVVAAILAESHLIDSDGDTDNSEVGKYIAQFIGLRMISPAPVVLKLDLHRNALSKLENAIDQDDASAVQKASEEVQAALDALESACRIAIGVNKNVGAFRKQP